MKKGFIIGGIAAGVLLLGGAGFVVLKNYNREKVPVISVQEIAGSFWGGYYDLSGNIASDVSQDIYLNSSQTVLDVYVKEGDEVKEGDPLIAYDMSMVNLDLEMKKLDQQGILLNIQKAQREIQKLKNTKPASDNNGGIDDPGGWDDPGMWEDPTDPEEPTEVVVAADYLDASSEPYMGEGTIEDPYHFLCKEDGVIKGEFLQRMAEEKCFFLIEVREGNSIELRGDNSVIGQLLKVWGQQILDVEAVFDPEAEFILQLDTKEKEEEVTEPEVYETLDAESASYKGDGSEEHPYTWVVASNGKVMGSFFNERKEQGGYFRIEIRYADEETGAVIRAWEMNADDLKADKFENAAEYYISLQVEMKVPEAVQNVIDAIDKIGDITDITETNLSEKEKEVQAARKEFNKLSEEQKKLVSEADLQKLVDAEKRIEELKENPEVTPSGTPDPTGEPTPPVTPDPTGEPTPTEKPDPTAEPTPPVTPDPTAEPTETPDPTDAPQPTITEAPTDVSEEPAGTEQATSNHKVKTMQTVANSVYTRVIRLDNMSTVDDVMGSNESYMTAEEIKKAIEAKQKEIKGYELDYQEADLEIRKIEKELKNQTVTSALNGVVKVAKDPEAENTDGGPLIQVVSSEGLYVKGTLSESLLDELQPGQKLSGYSYESGVSFVAEIKEISPYPSGSSYQSANASMYPFIAQIEDDSGLSNYSWVELTPMDQDETGEGSSVLINRPFVRSEDGKYYVMKEDENGTLVKQNVTVTGMLYGEYYRIAAGLSTSDRIAFPYGKNVVEGAKTTDGSLDQLYQ